MDAYVDRIRSGIEHCANHGDNYDTDIKIEDSW